MTKASQRRKSPAPSERIQGGSAEDHAAFQHIVAAFGNDREVVFGGGKGFGSAALKVNGKLFAMISSRGQFVAKLPGARVTELVALGHGEYFDPGRGRRMKEWLALDGGVERWKELAWEARRFVGRAQP